MKTFHLFIKSSIVVILTTIVICFYSCEENKNKIDSNESKKQEMNTPDSENKPSENISDEYVKGAEVYKQNCLACHQANGEGLPNAFPPLAKSDYLLADKFRAIKQVINGSTGEITVNGKQYNSTMPPQNITDEQIADVLNYVLHSWGNNGGKITPEEVKKERSN